MRNLESNQIQRRAFLQGGGSTLLIALTTSVGRPRVLLAQQQSLSSEELEQQLSALVEAYDAQGNHRTATSVDNASAEWLALEARRFGVEPSLESFTLSRVDPVSCHLRVAGRRIEGVLLFDGGLHRRRGRSG